MSKPLDRARLGRQARRKGQDFERSVAARLRQHGVEAKRNIQSRSGREGADLAVEGLHIECKTGAQPNLWGAMRQARRDAEDTGNLPVVAAHRESDVPFQAAEEVLVLPLDVGLKLLALARREGAL